jgi:hypothetical protein
VINYAWANPSTGIREQAGTKEEARERVWKELQKPPGVAAEVQESHGWSSNEKLVAIPVAAGVYEQEPVGWSSNEKFDLAIPEPWDSYAFTNPTSGHREIVGSFDMARIRIAEAWPEHAPVDSVTIYRQRLAFEVRWDDPEPEAPTPPEPEEETPSSLIAQVLAGNCADFGRAQLLASLWIADALQKRYRLRRVSRRNPGHRYRRYHPGVFRTLRRWWRIFWGTHWNRTSGQPNCQQCGQMLADPDGTICPRCAKAILQKCALESEGNVMPHVYRFPSQGVITDAPCAECGKLLDDAIHGYTGD